MTHVLVTRPPGQAGRLLEPLRRAGYRATHAPVMNIEPGEPDAAARQCLMNLDQYHAVFVASPNAARLAVAQLSDYWPQWPVGVHWIAVGESTAATLREAGLEPEVPPEGANSEAVLALPSLQAPQGQSVLLLRGTGGRELLAETLRERGARVDSVELYRRRCNPEFTWPAEAVHAVLVTSVESWHCLRERGGEIPPQTLVIAGSARIADAVREDGHERCVTAETPRDKDMMTCLAEHLPPEEEPQTMEETRPGDHNNSQEKAAPAPEKPAPSGTRRAAGQLPLLLLVLMLVAGAWMAWFWIEQGQAEREQLEERLSELEESVSEQARTQQQLLDTRGARLDELEAQMDERARELRELGRDGREHWMLREAELLAQLAGQRLMLTADVGGARRLLEAADTVLAELEGADVLETRQALGEDLDRLREADRLDIDGMVLRLGRLQRRAADLAHRGAARSDRASEPAEPAQPSEAAEEEAPVETTWQRILERLPLTIRRHDQRPELPLDKQESRQLELLLVGSLQQARQALLAGRSETYRQALAANGTLARRWLNEADPEVAGYLEDLAEMKEAQVEHAVPEIGAGHEAIVTLRRERTAGETEK